MVDMHVHTADGEPDVTGLEWENGAHSWPYPLLCIHKPSRSLVMFDRPMCGVAVQNRGQVCSKLGERGTGYSMDDFVPYGLEVTQRGIERFARELKHVWEVEGLEAMNELLTRTARGEKKKSWMTITSIR